jgi:hypothetical protein
MDSFFHGKFLVDIDAPYIEEMEQLLIEKEKYSL